MGPVAYMSMMSFESEHKSLKTFGRNANNFKNITKTIAYKKEAEFVYNGFTYQNKLSFGKVLATDLASFSDDERAAISPLLEPNEHPNEVQWFKMNGLTYRRGLAMIIDYCVCSIERILIMNEKCFLYCHRFDSLTFCSFTHSIVVEKGSNTNVKLFEFEKMTKKQLYEIKCVNGKYHIFAATLDVTNVLQ